MLAFYEGMGTAYGVPIRICLLSEENPNRSQLGWDQHEFSHLDIIALGYAKEQLFEALVEKTDWHQVFGAYQSNKLFQALILHAARSKMVVGVCSEAPLNMLSPGLIRNLKNIYLSYVVPTRVKSYPVVSDFVLNLSGSSCLALQKLGWLPEQVIPCGYFPPPLHGSSFEAREDRHFNDFHILCTGSLSWHRGQAVLLDALKLLKGWGLSVRATATQTGPLENSLKQTAHEHDLPIDFVGMVPMPQLINLLENCSCYVGTGMEEPWGIRVNDALHCGAPLVVSRGMGACKIVDDYRCGTTFNAADHVELAWKLRRMIEDRLYYKKVCERVAVASRESMPHLMAEKVVEDLHRDFPNWSRAN